MLGDGCWVLSLYETILLEVIITVLGDGYWVLSLCKNNLIGGNHTMYVDESHSINKLRI